MRVNGVLFWEGDPAAGTALYFGGELIREHCRIYLTTVDTPFGG